jgi:hypothetical protein
MGRHRWAHHGAAEPSPLCLRCRQAGHIMNNCPYSQWFSELDWFFSPARKSLYFGNDLETAQEELCTRCRDLNILRFLHEEIPWSRGGELDKVPADGSKYIRSLGKTGSIEFWSNCSLCRCLFALTPHPSSGTQDVLILPNWSIYRLEGGIAVDTAQKRRYAKCLLVALQPSQISNQLSDRAQRGDALCMIEDDIDYETTLGGRQINPNHLDIDIVQGWLSSCCRLHPIGCSPLWTENLRDIRLVDVFDRKIVSYPERRCDYIALSYVWGGLPQDSFVLGDKFSQQLPQTIEDAMAFTKKLEKRYLWVDSLCIEQRNETDKHQQIGKMSDIYRGAYATIIALSGESANAGLPRLGSNRRLCSQLSCCIEGKRLVGLMPTLSQLVWVSPWGSRAWTLQEALLSPRCLYVSDYQIYFECNAMQCSESLNEGKSWVHQVCHDSKSSEADSSVANVGGGVLRHPLVGLSGIKYNRLIEYGSGLALYSFRFMTDPADALNAFSGILQNLEKEYGEEFFWGIPVSEFQWGLIWRSQSTPKRRPGFPTWSWAGWEGRLWQLFPSDPQRPHQYQPHLYIWKASESELLQVFRSSNRMNGETEIEALFGNDPITKIAQLSSQDSHFDLRDYPSDEVGRYLFVEGIILQFTPDYSKPMTKVRERGVNEKFYIIIRDVPCLIEIMSLDDQLNKQEKRTKQEFLLVARDRSNGYILHYLLLLEFQEEVAKRVTTLTLVVPETRLDVLEELSPRKGRLTLS